jgi:hypothetical protein
MKYLRSYNESLRDLMTPKSENEILNSLKGLTNIDILCKSINYEFIKGVEIALQNELTKNDIKYIKEQIFYIKNKEIIKLLLNKIKDDLTTDQIYILEKYKLGLHQDEKRPYEIWFKTMLTNLEISKSKLNSNILIYKKNEIVLYNYNKENKYFWVNCDKIWSVFELKFHLNYHEISILTKGMVKEHLNLMDITTIEKEGWFLDLVKEHLNLKY